MEQLPVHVVATIAVCSSLGIVGFVVGGYVIYLGYFRTQIDDLGVEMVQINSIDILGIINDLLLEDPQFLLMLVGILLLLWDKS